MRWNMKFVVLISILACAPACESEQVTHVPAASKDNAARESVDALDRETAQRRKARLSGVEYAIGIDLRGGGDAFKGEITVGFDLSDVGSDLSLDFGGGTVRELRINDAPVPAQYNGFFLTLPAAALRKGRNTVDVAYTHPYSEDGTGLHRFVDPEDGRTYLYTYLWPYYANRLFPSFDQPNLKAKISLTVQAPGDWTVVSTGVGEKQADAAGTALWRFAATPSMSTYVFSLHAGPYRIWQDRAGDVPIRLMARQSVARFVAVDEWLEVTKRGLEYYGRYFGIPYPFVKYDQLIVPDFNIGAMENIGAVTFSEGYVQRELSDRSQRESRASVILHEMAHMWFGNLVTHDWWNGLWLNESFATQMAAMAAAEITEFDDTWHGFFTDDKQTAYARDSRVTTHPIEMPIESTSQFFTVFDAITYQKGSSVLKQLAHYIGEDAYRRGVSGYLETFAYDTTELADFIGHMEKASGLDLARWTEQWLHEPGFNTLTTDSACENGRLRELRVTQSAPADHPVLRTHRTDLALYDFDENGELRGSRVVPAEISGTTTVLGDSIEAPCPRLVNPNHDDWTYAKIVIDDQDVQALKRSLAALPDPLTRSTFLAALYDRVAAGDMPIADYVRLAMELSIGEENIRVQQQISASLVSAVDTMKRLRPETDEALATLLPRLEQMALDQAANASSDDLKRTGFSTFLDLAGSEGGLETVRNLLDGSTDIPGIGISPDVRWRMLTILSATGAKDIDELLARERAADRSDYGAKSALKVAAARRNLQEKRRWLRELQNPKTVTGLARQRAVMAGLFPAEQTDLQLELLGEVLEALPELSRTTDHYFLSSYASVLLTPMCRPESVAMMQAAIEEQADRLNSTAMRFLREAHQADRECLALRRT